MTDLERNLAETFGQKASHSDYRVGDVIHYQTESGVYTGEIIWVAAPGPSSVEGHSDLKLRYICQRQGWAPSSFPDVVYSDSILQDN